MSVEFVHLHVHTEYSLLDGAIKLKDAVNYAKRHGYSALAITDHGNIFGGIEFYEICLKEGIKPILGAELYVAPDSIKRKDKNEKLNHIILLAEDEEGYKSLSKLLSYSYIEGFYYKPRIDISLLSSYNKNLICLSGCKQGPLSSLILKDDLEAAKRVASLYKDIFKDRFFFELNYHFLEEEEKITETLINLSKVLEIPLVATNDVHYLERQDAEVHDILLCIQTQKKIHEDRLRFPTEEFYFKRREEMAELFPEVALKNTKLIEERCNLVLNFRGPLLPSYLDNKRDSEELLDRLCEEGLRKRYSNISNRIKERLNYEKRVIKGANLADYFLIIWDVVNFAKREGIPVGPGRGSVAGSLVAYLLGITDIDPIKYGLLFERFLNPGRLSLPDVDIDFCYFRRDKVLNYIKDKYGKDCCAQIITFGTMLKKAVLRDIGRALNINKRKIDILLKNLDEKKDTSWEELRQSLGQDKELERLILYSSKLEGQVRHVSTHAAGIVVSPIPLISIVPLYKDVKSGTIMTQYDKDSLEKVGLLKMDFLGLRTLTVISDTIKFIEKNDKKFSLEDVLLEDELTYKLLSRGDTSGLFQLESQGMRELLTALNPDKFEDLIAAIALYRPGPIGSGMIKEFLNNKRSGVRLPHPALKNILEETYGTIVYQEQVMKIAEELAGFSASEADDLRRAMSKKDSSLMYSYREKFREGCKNKYNISYSLADSIFEQLFKFASYGFNKSHAAAYALIAFWTAYLKRHYPTYYLCALLSSEMNNTDKLINYIKECKKLDIRVLPPSVNSSEEAFSPVGKKSIRFGLQAIKDLSSNLIEAILEERTKGKFGSLNEFFGRLPSKLINKKNLESLIKSGSLDDLYSNRKALLASVDRLLSLCKSGKSGQQLLFGDESMIINLDSVEEDKRSYILWEYEVLGISIMELFPVKKALHIRIPEEFSEENIKELKDRYLSKYFSANSKIQLFLHIQDKTILANSKFNIKEEEELKEELSMFVGKDNVWYE